MKKMLKKLKKVILSRFKRVAHILIVNYDGQVLYVSRKYEYDKLGLAGGKLNWYEFLNPKKGLIREVKEETGLILNPKDCIKVMKRIYKDQTALSYITFVYKGEINYNEPHDVGWINFDELIEKSPFKDNLNELKKELGVYAFYIS